MNAFGLRLPTSGLQFASPLDLAAWTIAAGVPVGIIALYFLKLRRRPVRVPSTLLWRRSMEDMHVNSLFQRLRRNLLLFLQLLAVLLAMLALAGPRFNGSAGEGRRLVLAIDQSASMSATDIAPSRLAKAKAEARKVVESMEDDDLAMVIAFSDRARVVSNYTSNRRDLARRIDSIGPTQASTSLREALQVAAGLANPSKMIEGVPATSILAPKLLIYTDGGFSDVEGFSLGNLEPEVIVIGPPSLPNATAADGETPAGTAGTPPSDNVAILALQAGRNEDRPEEFQVFGRVRNFKAEDVETRARLLRHDPLKPSAEPVLVDEIGLKLPAQGEQSFKFDLPDAGSAQLEVRLDLKDAQPLDDRAYALVGNMRQAKVLVVTTGNRYLIDTLQTSLSEERADVVVVSPDALKADPVARDLASGVYDMAIFDRVTPAENPEANALYFGSLPPGPAYAKSTPVSAPIVMDWNVGHPLLQFIRDLPTIRISKALSVEPPVGSTVLIEGNGGPLAFLAPRAGGYADAVVTFSLVDGKEFNTDWVLKYSFPLFLYNALQLLGNVGEAVGEDAHPPGQPIVLRADAATESVTLTDPSGGSTTLPKTTQGTFVVNATDRTGFYRASWTPKGEKGYAVNQFDPREADLSPRGLVPAGVTEAAADAYKIKIGYNPVAGTKQSAPARVDWWKPLAVLALGVLLVEWYIYNRRVYL
jgi:hypothetical protein